MTRKLTEDDLDFSRGDDDILFIQTPFDTSETMEDENAREKIMEKLTECGLELKNSQIIAVFKEEISVMMKEEAKIILNGETVYTRE